MREFSDVYYFTQEVSLSLSPTHDPFKQQPLPDIGGEGSKRPSIMEAQKSNVSLSMERGMSNAQMSNVFKKVNTVNLTIN